MLKRFVLLFVCAVLFVGTGCSSLLGAVSGKPASSGVPYTPMKFSGDKPLWPAVMHAATKGKFYCEDTNLNVLGDVYRFERCLAQGSDRIRFNTIVKRSGDEVGVDVASEWFDSDKRQWKPGLPMFATADIDGARSQVIADIEEAIKDESVYASTKSRLYNNLLFHVSVMEDMTTAGKEIWIERLRKSKTKFTSEATLGDVDKVDKDDARAKSFAYRVFLILEKPGGVPFALVSNTLTLYTNDEALVTRQKGERVSFNGAVVDYLDSPTLKSFIMEQ